MSKSKYKKRDIYTLIIMAQHGESKALEELVRRVQKNIFAMFSYLTDKRQDIADLTQEALLKMARNIASLKDPARFKPWLNQIVTNVFYDYVKKHNVEIVALTLPKGPAKKIAQKLVECGVKAFWNFAHTDLSFSDDIIVENVHLSESLMKLTYRISEKNDSKE